MNNPADLIAVGSALLLLLLSTHATLEVLSADEVDEENCFEMDRLRQPLDSLSLNAKSVSSVALHAFRLSSIVHLLGEDLGFWVKPRSTTWFFRFVLEQYEEDRWVKLFCMTKPSLFALAEILKPNIVKKDTRYHLAIPVVVRVACTLFKLTQGASLLICSEMFAIGRSSVSMLLRDVVHTVNVVLRSEITWLQGPALVQVEANFQWLCSIPGVLGAIDGTHVTISKPKIGASDYFYFKSGSFTINYQAVVDSEKRFLDLFLGMPGSMNDSRVLRRSTLYQKASNNTLWDAGVSFEGFSPFLLGDVGYPCLSWLMTVMTPHHEYSRLTISDALYNKKHCRGRGVVENAFALLKHTFRELLYKSDLDVTFVPDVITACAILHNMLLRQTASDVDCLLNVLRQEGLREENDNLVVAEEDVPPPVADENPLMRGFGKRRDLGLYLAGQRGLTLT